MVVNAYNSSSWRQRQENSKFEASPDYSGSHPQNANKPSMVLPCKITLVLRKKRQVCVWGSLATSVASDFQTNETPCLKTQPGWRLRKEGGHSLTLSAHWSNSNSQEAWVPALFIPLWPCAWQYVTWRKLYGYKEDTQQTCELIYSPMAWLFFFFLNIKCDFLNSKAKESTLNTLNGR